MSAYAHPDARHYSAVRLLQSLEAIAHGPVSARELGDRTGCNVRTARRLLYQLRAEGYVDRGPLQRDGFYATEKLAALGAQLAHR